MKRIFAYLLCRKRKQKNNKMTTIPIVDDVGNARFVKCKSCDEEVDCEQGGNIFCLSYSEYIEINLCQGCFENEKDQFKKDGWECDDFEDYEDEKEEENYQKQTEMLWELLSELDTSPCTCQIELLIDMFGEKKVKNIFYSDYEDWKERFGDDEEDEDEDEDEEFIKCKDCNYAMDKSDFDAGRGRVMFSSGNDIEDGEYCCGVCDERCDDPEGLMKNEEEEEDEDVHEDGEECRYCDNDDCLYGGYIYDEELEKYKGKSYICIGCSTGVSLQEQEQEGIEVVIFTWEGKDYLKSIDNTIYDKSTWDTIGKWDPIKLELII